MKVKCEKNCNVFMSPENAQLEEEETKDDQEPSEVKCERIVKFSKNFTNFTNSQIVQRAVHVEKRYITFVEFIK